MKPIKFLHVHIRARTMVARSTLDQACLYDTSNRVFYIYQLGAYFNKPYYLYGETNDIDQTDLMLRCTLPIYKLVYTTPVDYHAHAIQTVDTFLHENRDTLPIQGCKNWNTFSCTEEALGTILEKIDSLYMVESN